MNFEKLAADVYSPSQNPDSLKNIDDIKFNYYLSSRINGKLIDLDITSKLFYKDLIYVRKSCYRINMGQLEECVKSNIINHMRSLGMDKTKIPESLWNLPLTKRRNRISKSVV